MKLFLLSIALIVLASCKSGESATNSNSFDPPSNKSERASGADSNSKDPCLNLNSATAEDFVKLPGVGDVMAKKIIDFRARHGRFRRPQELIIIEGFSEKKYRDIARMICVE
jgi:competence protein ComEA